MNSSEAGNRRVPLVITLLGSEVLNGTQRLDSAQQQLNHTVPRPSRVPRQLVAGQLDLVVRQASLVAERAHDAGLAQTAVVVLGVEGHVELLVLRVLLEALEAVPGRVLEREERAVGREDVVEAADADDGVVGVLDDALQDLVLRGGRGGVARVRVGVAAAEDVLGGALVPRDMGRVDCVLDVGAVEVDLRALGAVVTL